MIEMKRAILIVILLALCPIADASMGIGISPASITISDAYRGGRYEQRITIYNTGDEPGTFTLTAEGECGNWISFSKEEDPRTAVKELMIPAKDRVKVITTFDIPADAENRDYTALIYAQSVPKEETGEGAVMSAVVRIPQKVVIQVTGTQILKGTVERITVADTEVEYPLKIAVVFQNEGNVIARPKIAVSITKDSTLVDNVVHDEIGIKPGKTDTITVLWDTSESGNYTASVIVSLSDEVLAKRDVPFSILPMGALTRKGVLKSLFIIEDEPQVNYVLKVLAAFENTGTIDARAKFNGEIYHNGKLADVVESDEKLVGVGEESQLHAYYKIAMPGAYTIQGVVIYDGKETDTKEISFTVPEPESGSVSEEEGKPWIPGFELVSTVIALILISSICVARRRAKR
jgi:hypothetical protein